MQIRRIRRTENVYNIFFDFETITPGNTHEPYLCWTYNNDTQHEFKGVNNCATDMLNSLATDKQQI